MRIKHVVASAVIFLLVARPWWRRKIFLRCFGPARWRVVPRHGGHRSGRASRGRRSTRGQSCSSFDEQTHRAHHYGEERKYDNEDVNRSGERVIHVFFALLDNYFADTRLDASPRNQLKPDQSSTAFHPQFIHLAVGGLLRINLSFKFELSVARKRVVSSAIIPAASPTTSPSSGSHGTRSESAQSSAASVSMRRSETPSASCAATGRVVECMEMQCHKSRMESKRIPSIGWFLPDAARGTLGHAPARSPLSPAWPQPCRCTPAQRLDAGAGSGTLRCFTQILAVPRRRSQSSGLRHPLPHPLNSRRGVERALPRLLIPVERTLPKK